MKKIGICTLQFANNYGAILQAFSLQEVIKKMGYDVEFLKLRDYPQNLDAFNFEGFERSKEKLNLSKEFYNVENTKYDTIVIGSDELWNLNNKSFEHLEEYFGKNLATDNIISYAPSANGLEKETLESYYGSKVKFEEFKKLSVRDRKTQKLIKDVSGRDAKLVLDPTMLMDTFEPYIKIKSPELKDYIAIYGYEFTPEEQNKILEFAKEKNKKVYAIGLKMDWCETLEADIFEFLGYFKNADYIITNTFHGLLFSVILEKQFVVFSEENAKIQDIIETLQIENREVINGEHLSTIFEKNVDYEKINKIRQERKEESFNYLKNAIS